MPKVKNAIWSSLTVFLTLPTFYSCNPDAAHADDALYLQQGDGDLGLGSGPDGGNTGDDDGEILPPDTPVDD